LFFSLILGKMTHWTMPAVVPMSILSARMILTLWRRFAAGRSRLIALAYDLGVVFMILLFLATGLNTARTMGIPSLSVPDPKSPVAKSMVPIFNSSRWFVDDLRSVVTSVKPQLILAPNWVTASEVMFYLPEFRDRIYVFEFDYQLGTVWGMDVHTALGCSPMRRLRRGEKDPNVGTHIEGYYMEKGYLQVRIVKWDPLFDGLGDVLLVDEGHYCEIKRLPTEFELLASGDECKIQAMKHSTRLVYGVQFHPNVYDDGHPDGKRILDNFIRISTATQRR